MEHHSDTDRQKQEEWLTEEDKRIIAEAIERFDIAFDLIFKSKQEQP